MNVAWYQKAPLMANASPNMSDFRPPVKMKQIHRDILTTLESASSRLDPCCGLIREFCSHGRHDQKWPHQQKCSDLQKRCHRPVRPFRCWTRWTRCPLHGAVAGADQHHRRHANARGGDARSVVRHQDGSQALAIGGGWGPAVAGPRTSPDQDHGPGCFFGVRDVGRAKSVSGG